MGPLAETVVEHACIASRVKIWVICSRIVNAAMYPFRACEQQLCRWKYDQVPVPVIWKEVTNEWYCDRR